MQNLEKYVSSAAVKKELANLLGAKKGYKRIHLIYFEDQPG
jgi:hypothetical protein